VGALCVVSLAPTLESATICKQRFLIFARSPPAPCVEVAAQSAAGEGGSPQRRNLQNIGISNDLQATTFPTLGTGTGMGRGRGRGRGRGTRREKFPTPLFRIVVRLFRHCYFRFGALFLLRRGISRALVFFPNDFKQLARCSSHHAHRRHCIFPLYFYCCLQWRFPFRCAATSNIRCEAITGRGVPLPRAAGARGGVRGGGRMWLNL
jgi:hypothetical protein